MNSSRVSANAAAPRFTRALLRTLNALSERGADVDIDQARGELAIFARGPEELDRAVKLYAGLRAASMTREEATP